MADILFIAGSTALTTATSSVTVTKPAGVTKGDVMIAALSIGALPIVAVLNGWRELPGSPVEVDVTGGSGGAILVRLHVYTLVADDGEPASYTWDLEGATTASFAAAIVAYRNVDNTSPVNVSAKIGTASGPTTTVPGFTTTVDKAMQVAIYSVDTSGTYTPPSGMAERTDVESGFPRHLVSTSDVLLGTAGAVGSKTATPSLTGTSGAFSVALEPAVVPTIVIGAPPGLPEDIAGGFSLG